MAKTRTYNYEAMFVISQSTAVDLQGAVDHIKEILTKAGASLIAMKKWDERRFTFEIKKQKRGVYILAYFSAPASGLAAIERSCNLSEKILRVLFTRADHLTIDEMKAADAQKELADEAKLRAQRAAEGLDMPVVAASRADDAEEPEDVVDAAL
ncbi:MAG: 30S ribosomal protein S6 [Phycisphaerales bacterium]